MSSDHARIMLGSWSNRLYMAEAVQGFSADLLNSQFRGRRSIWCCWTVTSVAPRIVNDVSYVICEELLS